MCLGEEQISKDGEVRDALMQMPHLHPRPARCLSGSGLLPQAMTWSVTLMKSERIELCRGGPTLYWLKHFGEKALHFTSVIQ